MHIDTPCPACSALQIDMNTATTDVPYFGECLETSIVCRACGFKHTDLLMLEQREPARFTLAVEEEAHLFARVVRGSSGTIRIPEMGVLIEPGPLAESFVSNVEGVLNRVDKVVGQLSRGGGAEQKKSAEGLIARIERARQGQERFTLIVEDPFGNSAIVHPEAVRTVLAPEEAKHLKTGMTILDLEDIMEDAGQGEDFGGRKGKGKGDDDDDVPSVDDLLKP